MQVNIATLTPPVDSERDHVRGDPAAPVTLVEYADFQCPYCGDAYPVVHELLERFGDRLRFVFRHMPLRDLHPRAEAAAEAAEAAGAQGRFWEMHDRLFTHQQQLSDGDLGGHAEAIGLDVERFEREVRERRHAGRVADDYLSGARSGTPSTPRFFVNGVIHLGSPSLPELEEAISAEVPLEGPRG
ncbi:MAG TPA: thioredoxin domain-containing protein [Thermoleophilaceae bacterium]|nr:thioredoxin domain-containing protein [Thermoleophilaceae bacterium]